ncbi:MAG: hypothetical protein ACLT07_02370 [Clostridia bacterium]
MDASLHPWFGRSKTTSIPQAKGRIERLFQTLQSRLPIELRLAGISNLGQTNEFLASCLKEFNTQFALDMGCTRSVFEKQDEQGCRADFYKGTAAIVIRTLSGKLYVYAMAGKEEQSRLPIISLKCLCRERRLTLSCDMRGLSAGRPK